MKSSRVSKTQELNISRTFFSTTALMSFANYCAGGMEAQARRRLDIGDPWSFVDRFSEYSMTLRLHTIPDDRRPDRPGPQIHTIGVMRLIFCRLCSCCWSIIWDIYMEFKWLFSGVFFFDNLPIFELLHTKFIN